MKNLSFTKRGWEDYLFWQETDKKTLKRINLLIKEISRNPFQGIGDPEPLKYGIPNRWSRRINQKDRIVYAVFEEGIFILQCRYHYDD